MSQNQSGIKLRNILNGEKSYETQTQFPEGNTVGW
jgi:hypothetical protein